MNSIMELVCQICTNVRHKAEAGVSFKKVLGLIRTEFRLNDLDIKIKVVKDKNLNVDVFYVNGYYDPEDDKNLDCPIELILTHNFTKEGVWHTKNVTDLLVQIYDSYIHEYRHQGQYRKRNYRPSPPHNNEHQLYLKDPDEIDAYAISITFELCRSLGKHRAIRYLHNTNLLSKFKLNGAFASPSLGMYKLEFPKYGDPVINRLTKKVYTRLQKVDTDLIFM